MEQLFVGASHGAVGDGTSANPAVAVTINCGFKPKYVQAIVVDTNCVTTTWIYGMTAAKGVQSKEDTGYKSAELAATGITVTDRGFTLGASAQVATKKYHWIALG